MIAFATMTILLQSPGSSLDSFSGSAGLGGWVGASLLGGVLSWLMWVHLPAKDKQLSQLLDAKDKQMSEMVTARNALATELAAKVAEISSQQRTEFSEAIAQQRADFRESLKTIIDHCQRETETTGALLRKDFERLDVAIRGLQAAISAMGGQHRQGHVPGSGG